MSTYLKHFPKPLLEDLVAGRWLPIIGAGLSRNAAVPGGESVPLWNELGEILSSDLPDYSFVGALDAISAFEQEYGRPKLIEKLTNVLLIDRARPGGAHRAFCSIAFDLVCTTNFDFLLERQYASTPRSCTPLIDESQLSVGLQNSGVALLKLRGDLHHPDRLVATEEDYDLFLHRYPLLATYLSCLLITRTAVLVGYSLDDPDFRQVWQILGERLGRSRRLAYAVTVGARPADIARFARRYVKVVNLPGKITNYSQILEDAFHELREYWRDNVIAVSQVTEEGPLQELSLPRHAATRLCFFAIPLAMHPFYRDRVFPIVRDAGLVPITADGVVSSSESINAKIDALIDRAFLVVVDASTDSTIQEARMAMRRDDPASVLVIADTRVSLPSDILKLSVLRRPDLVVGEIQPFLDTLRGRFQEAASDHAPSLFDEPQRLFAAREYRASVIAAITLLETILRSRLKGDERPATLRRMLADARTAKVLSQPQLGKLEKWLRVRNEAVHSHALVRKQDALEVVEGVVSIVKRLLER